MASRLSWRTIVVTALGTRRFQRAVVEKDSLIGIIHSRSRLASAERLSLYNPAHPALSALRASDGSSTHDWALEAARTQGARKTLTPSPDSRKTWLIPRLMIPLPANIIFYTGEFNSI